MSYKGDVLISACPLYLCPLYLYALYFLSNSQYNCDANHIYYTRIHCIIETRLCYTVDADQSLKRSISVI